MRKWFKQLDDILRGAATEMPSLREGRIDMRLGGVVVVSLLLGVIYGLCMGSFAMIRTGGAAYMQMVAAAVKIPLLFSLTLAVTFPSLYVFNALFGSKLSLLSVLRLLVAGMAVTLAVLSSLGPIIVFFAVSTTSYSFMVVLNVAAGGLAGVLGLGFLLRTLHRLVLVQEDGELVRALARARPAGNDDPPPPVDEDPPPLAKNDDEAQGPAGQKPPLSPAEDGPKPKPKPAAKAIGPLDRIGESTHEKARIVFKVWVVVYALVGSQMSWVLRPFIGDPTIPFEWFRQREGNFFVAVAEAIEKMFGG